METDNKETGHEEMKEMLEKNSELLAENNKLLKKIHRSGVWGMWIRIAWYVLLLGLPFALYYYLLEPYFATFGASIDVFNAGMQEIPGIKIINDALNAG